jgi:hypothetical protein
LVGSKSEIVTIVQQPLTRLPTLWKNLARFDSDSLVSSRFGHPKLNLQRRDTFL